MSEFHPMNGLRETQFALREAVEAWDQAGGVSAGLADDELHQAAYDLREAAEEAIAALAASWTEEDTCRVGDVDPTPSAADGDACDAEDQGWTCTRFRDHPGRQHVAGNGSGRRVVHVWPWSPSDCMDYPAGISSAFTARELDTLVITAAEALNGGLSDPSGRQIELAARAYKLHQREVAGGSDAA